jgi:transcriptional regulator with XRE-family HTH domain
MTSEQFRNIRLALNMSQTEFALLLGYEHRSTISNFESGRRRISPRLKMLVMAKSSKNERGNND